MKSRSRMAGAMVAGVCMLAGAGLVSVVSEPDLAGGLGWSPVRTAQAQGGRGVGRGSHAGQQPGAHSDGGHESTDTDTSHDHDDGHESSDTGHDHDDGAEGGGKGKASVDKGHRGRAVGGGSRRVEDLIFQAHE